MRVGTTVSPRSRMRPTRRSISRRVDALDAHAHLVAQADRRAGALAEEDRPLLVELPPVATQPAHRQQALVVVLAEDDERARADHRDDLAVVLGLEPALEHLALEQERARDVVGVALDDHRRALALAGPRADGPQPARARRVLAAADRAEQRPVADEVGIAADGRGEVAVAREPQARVADVAR